ncbi:MAG: DnaJ domain-containing protein [Candidatus Brocadiae bacterium]|nr:DnaJ domain-containing protein [Candidatus Brocadiia bacterium]
MVDDLGFQDVVTREVEARHLARKVLGVHESASPEDLKRAWRRACHEMHPDRNPGDPDAQRRFRVVNCAYRLLVNGTPCDELPDDSEGQQSVPRDTKYNLDNMWGLFLWWREKFF